MKCKYKSTIILSGRDNGRSFYFNEGTVELQVTPYQSAEDMENERISHELFHRGPRLGEWGGSLVLPYGSGIQSHLARYWWETDKHHGDIWLEKAEIIGDGNVEVWFRGSGDLVSLELETELKKMLYVPPRP
jgi:hypothetical protein